MHQSKWLKHNYFCLHAHVHELGTMSVILLFFFYMCVYITMYFAVIFVSIRHRYINGDVPNIHTRVSAVHTCSVPDAVSLDFVSDGVVYMYTNVVQRGDIYMLHFSGWLLFHRVCISIAYSPF